MTIPQKLIDLQADYVAQRLRERNIEAFYCHTKDEALELALSFIPEGCFVSKGGSLSVEEIGLIDALREGPYNFLEPSSGHDVEEIKAIAIQAMSADVFFTSVNALSADGQLVMIDGIGNRVSAVAFGPKRIVAIVGMNKFEPNLKAAIERAENFASMACAADRASNYLQLEEAARTAGNMTLVVRGNVIAGRMSVVLVAESLGY
jgi:L-lactate utilization protein LutB